MKKYMPIIKDGLILIVVSTAFVTVTNYLFKGLKKTSEADPIVTAVSQGKIDPLKEILSQQAYEANKAGFENLQAYLEDRANRRDEFLRTPLMRVALANFSDPTKTLELDKTRVPFVEFLAANGGNVNAVDSDGWTALMWAAWSGMPEVASKLLEVGTDSNKADKVGNTALVIAAMRGNIEVVKVLIEKGADRDVRTIAGKTAADIAREYKAQYRESSAKYEAILELLGQASAPGQG